MTKQQKIPAQQHELWGSQQTMPETGSHVKGCSNEPGNTSDNEKVNECRHYNTIIGTSRDAEVDPRYRIGPLVTEADIISSARGECGKNGESLAEQAGIEWEKSEDGFMVAAREWEPGEEFYTALAKLNDEGRLYEIYDCESEVDAFLDRAEQLGIGSQAPRKRGTK